MLKDLFKTKKQKQIEKLDLKRISGNLYSRVINGGYKMQNGNGKVIESVEQKSEIFYNWDSFLRMFVYSHMD